MNQPKNLNQIFYGPPGTGKTHTAIPTAEEIISENLNNQNKSNIKHDLDRVVRYIRTNFNTFDHNTQNGKNLYRNSRRIYNIWGYILEAEKYGLNEITNNFVSKINPDLKNGFIGSGWAQHYRYVTHFGFVNSWNDKKISLNEKGIRFKEKLKEWLNKDSNNSEYKIDDQKILYLETLDKPNDLLEPIFLDEYIDSIYTNACSKNISGFVKTILCALFMALDGKLYGHAKADLPASKIEENEIQKYYDLNDKRKDKDSLRDLEWTGWITANLEELGLVEKVRSDERNNYYELTSNGKELIEKIVAQWRKNMPTLFDKILYKNALDLGFIKIVTFHQSYSYEEFVEGIRPSLSSEESDIQYELNKGVFREISDKALVDPSNNYVLIIDEINRGNVSKIFGELITLIEDTKRIDLDLNTGLKVQLPYSKDLFGVPKNLYIIGTMNSVDKSITAIDSALRRRFSFIEFPALWNHPNIKKINHNSVEIDLKKILKKLNERIEYLLDKDHSIGHSYFFGIENWEDLCDVFRDKIIPLLQEYFYNDFEKIALVFGDGDNSQKNNEEKFIIKENYLPEEIFGKGYPSEDDKDKYIINENLINKNYSNISVNFFTKGF